MNEQLRIKIPLLPGAVPENSLLINSGTNRSAETPYKAPGLRHHRSTLLENNTPVNKAYGPTGLEHASSTLPGKNTPVISPSNVTVSVAPTSSMSVAPTLSVPVPVPVEVVPVSSVSVKVAPGQASLWTRMYYGDATKRFISAFERNDEKEMEKAIRQGADIKKWLAGFANQGTDLSMRDDAAYIPGGGFPLVWATDNGYLEILRFLIDQGANVNATTRRDWTSLMSASQRGHLEIARLLLAKGANVNAETDVGGAGTPLQLASQYGHLEMVRLLLAAGADVNAATMEKWKEIGEGLTALMVASSGGHLEVARLLLAKGANVNAAAGAGIWGRTSLMMAIQGRHLEMVKLLCSAGADINQRDFYLAKAEDYAHNLEIKKFLETSCHKTTEGGKFSIRKRAKRTRRKVTGKNKSKKKNSH